MESTQISDPYIHCGMRRRGSSKTTRVEGVDRRLAMSRTRIVKKSQRISWRKHLRSFAILVASIALVAAFAVVLHALSTPPTSQGASVHTSTPGCHRVLNASEIQVLSGQNITVNAESTSIAQSALAESKAFSASTQQLVQSATTKATDIACQLAYVSAPNIHPLVNGEAITIQHQLIWIIMYQGLGPKSHGPSSANKPHDLYMFLDGANGAYLFGLSAEQPPKA